MDAIALVIIACLPHTNECRSLVQQPPPLMREECNRRAEDLQRTLTGSIDDSGYVPRGVTCFYGASGAPEEAAK